MTINHKKFTDEPETRRAPARIDPGREKIKITGAGDYYNFFVIIPTSDF
jgi:hypothetical protein